MVPSPGVALVVKFTVSGTHPFIIDGEKFTVGILYTVTCWVFTDVCPASLTVRVTV